MPQITPQQRATRVVDAINELTNSVNAAAAALLANGPSHTDTLAAWERVEKAGAIVHRQSRLLAGKSKGG